MRKALVIGIDDYKDAPLTGCVNDANDIAQLLEANGGGDPNFDVKRLLSNEVEVTTELMLTSLAALFSPPADTVVLFFAGHGFIRDETGAGFIISQDGTRAAPGISLQEILTMANDAYPQIRSSVIILDACQSGFLGELGGRSGTQASILGTGVTILTACRKDESAAEQDGHGLFTGILIDGLKGSAADILGRITPASLYSHIDQTLGSWEQRPVYKANVQTFVVLREMPPKIPREIIRKLPTYFQSPSSVFPLDPSCEPDRGEESERLSSVPVDPDKEEKYREMQALNRHGLVVPVNQAHMWHAAVYATGCKLTAAGAHYRRLAELRRI